MTRTGGGISNNYFITN